MRRYTVGIGDREFVVDVSELDADRFAVAVGEENFEVTLQGDEDLPEARIAPVQPSAAGQARSAAPSTPARAVAAAPRVAKPRSAGGSLSALAAPMPGVILELHVKAGDRVERGQPVAVLDAMKMHNLIGAPRAGVIAEVCVAAGQAVGHGDPIVRFGD
jgi:biotin carboxyl carrier protein